VPFLVRWPGVTKPGSTCGQTIGSVDLMATLAEILAVKLPATAGEDSVSLLPLLRGQDRPIHDLVVHHSSTGVFALRSDNWKLIVGPGGGAPDGTRPHLYDLKTDPGERRDVAPDHPDIVNRLLGQMNKIVADGRSTPGEKQKNDVPIQVVKKAQPPRE
jgi:arylsulfatase A-like enzyme